MQNPRATPESELEQHLQGCVGVSDLKSVVLALSIAAKRAETICSLFLVSNLIFFFFSQRFGDPLIVLNQGSEILQAIFRLWPFPVGPANFKTCVPLQMWEIFFFYFSNFVCLSVFSVFFFRNVTDFLDWSSVSFISSLFLFTCFFWSSVWRSFLKFSFNKILKFCKCLILIYCISLHYGYYSLM